VVEAVAEVGEESVAVRFMLGSGSVDRVGEPRERFLAVPSAEIPVADGAVGQSERAGGLAERDAVGDCLGDGVLLAWGGDAGRGAHGAAAYPPARAGGWRALAPGACGHEQPA